MTKFIDFKTRIKSSVIILTILAIIIIASSIHDIFLFISLSCIAIQLTFEWRDIWNDTANMSKEKWHIIGTILILLLINSSFVIFTNSTILLLIAILSATTIDSVAYMTGKFLGGPKLCTKVSAGKTWSGTIVGLLTGIVVLSSVLVLTYNLHIGIVVALATMFALLSQGGDLLISYFKRKMQVKDTGNFIPGHGGLWDRLDSMILSLPLIAIVAIFIH